MIEGSGLWARIRSALAEDRARTATRVPPAETEFLPAALEVIERPVSPTGRITAWVLVALLVVTAAWLVLGKVDVVTSAPGRVLPAGSSKIIQAPSGGVITAIRVEDGQRVRAGNVLIEFDPTIAAANLTGANEALDALELDVARGRAIVSALEGHGLQFVAPPGTPPALAEVHRKLAAAQVAQLEANVAGYGAARTSALADADAARATVDRLDNTLPILDREVAAMRELDAKGYAPGLRLMEMQRQQATERGDRAVAAAQAARGASEAGKYADAIAESRENARRTALADLARAEADAALRREDVAKATRRASWQTIRSPIDGTVQELAVHTLGGVVPEARALMIVVPERRGIEVEAHVPNREVGFVHEGQDTALKIDAFPFSRYGTVPGRVISLSRDAVVDRRTGATYTARIRVDPGTIMVDGKAVPLVPGMTVTADIHTGQRRIVSWLLSPLQTTLGQAGRER